MFPVERGGTLVFKVNLKPFFFYPSKELDMSIGVVHSLIMKKYIPHVAGAILGLLFIMSGMMVLLKLAPMPKLPEGSPAALFMGAFGPTGYLTFVKVLEVLGGILLIIPKTRNFGLLVLGPILVNILAFHIFITNGDGLLDPMLIVIVALALYLLWVGRTAFKALLNDSGTRSANQ